MAIDKNDSDGTHVFPGQQGNVPLQVTRWTGNRVVATSSGATARLTIPAGATLIEIAAAEAVYLNFGDVTVEAVADVTSHLFLAGVQVIPVPFDSDGDPFTYVALIQVATAGLVQVEELA